MNGRIQPVLDSAPISVTLYDSLLALIDCNMGDVGLFELSEKKHFLNVVGTARKQEFVGLSISDFRAVSAGARVWYNALTELSA